VRRFVQLINNHDVDGMVALVAEDHTFTDAIGGVVSGRERMRSGWIGYFKWFPDYRIEIKELYSLGNNFVLIGFASGTHSGRKPNRGHWRLPAAWRAVVRRGLVREWSVFCDTRTPYEILEKDGPTVEG